MRRAYTERHRDWDVELAETEFATRSTVNRSTGFAPCFLNLGRELHFPQDNALTSRGQGGGQRSFCQFAVNLRKRLADTVKAAPESLDVARLQQATQYYKRRRDVHFQRGLLGPATNSSFLRCCQRISSFAGRQVARAL